MKSRNFLFSKTKYLQKDITEVSVQKGSGIGGGYWVLNRGLCVYKSINLAGIAKKDRGAALAIRLQQLSPFAHPGHFIAFHEDTAQIWLWDASAQKRAALDLRAVKAEPVPETLLLEKPPDGLFLCACLRGYELQYWQNSTLIHSKWWSRRPTGEETTLFSAANDLTEREAKLFFPGPWLNRPWANAVCINALSFARFERRLVLALFCATAFLGVYYATQSLLFHQRVQKIKHEQHELERSIQPILEARATAASDVKTIKAIAALNPAPPLTAAFGEAVQLLRPARLKVVGWQYQTPTLLLHLRGPRPPEPSVLVRDFEENRFFSDVSFAEDASSKTLTLTMTLNRPEESRELTAP